MAKTAKKTKRKAPTVEEVKAMAQKDKAYWADRNKEFEKWQKAWELRTKATAKAGEQTVQVNDGKVIVNKLAAAISADHRIVWPAPPDSLELTDTAQKGENMLRWARAEMSIAHAEGLHGPLEWEEAQSCGLRGYVAGRILLDPENPGFPWKYDLLDMANLYPRMAGNRLVRVTHQYKAKEFELVDEFPDLKLDPTSDAEKIVIGYYDDTYMGVVVGDEEAKKIEEHGYGFCPVIVVAAAGGFYGATDYDDTEWIKHRGEGILAGIYDAILDKQEILSMMKTLLAKETNPPSVLYTSQDGQTAEYSLKPGMKNVEDEKAKIELLRVGPNFQELATTVGGFQDEVAKGSFQPALYGDMEGGGSGFRAYIAKNSAIDIIKPYLEALQIYYTLLYRRMVQLYINFGADELVFYGINAKSGEVVSGLKLSPDELSKLGPNIQVRFKTATMQDQITMAQTAALLGRDKILSLETVRGEWLGIDDPTLENRKVMSEMIFMDPNVMKALAQASAIAMNDPMVLQAIQAQQQAQMPAPAAAGAQGAPPAAAPEGLPANVNPPELGVNAGAIPGTDLLAPQGSGPDQAAPPDVLKALLSRGGM